MLKALLIASYLSVTSVPLSPTYLGVNGKALADADGANVPATTASIPMDTSSASGAPPAFQSQLLLLLVVTWGTTTSMTGFCQYSPDGTDFGPWAACTAGPASTCKPIVFTWTAADWPSGKIPMNVPNAGIAAKCQWWDAASGTGTIIVKGTRTYQ